MIYIAHIAILLAIATGFTRIVRSYGPGVAALVAGMAPFSLIFLLCLFDRPGNWRQLLDKGKWLLFYLSFTYLVWIRWFSSSHIERVVRVIYIFIY